MCGIAGRVNAERDRPVDAEALCRATRILSHRGPDGEGYYLKGPVGLGHRRLAIVDRSGGRQPLSNEDGTVWAIFNGEIYNHLSLRAELEKRGHRFSTHSDTEVLVHGYEEWGKAMVQRLRGMFAFALWDERKNGLLLARDRLGIKPLYLTHVGKDFLFASEVKALFCFADVRREEDTSRLPEYLALRYVPGPGTMFRGIGQLPPGHLLWVEPGSTHQESYWDIPLGASAEPVSEGEAAEQLASLLEESVRLRLMGEVPVGLFLSGGIDSTAVAWAMKRHHPGAVKSFSVGYENDAFGELSYARSAAESLKTQHQEIEVTAESFAASLQSLVWHLDEPLSDGACIPLMQLAKKAREEVVIVLSGEGADEVFGGYGIYKKMLGIEAARRTGGRVWDGACRAALWGPWPAKARKYLHMARKPLQERYFGVGRAFSDEQTALLFGPGALKEIAGRYSPYWQRSKAEPALHQLLYVDTKVWLPCDLLTKADKTTMAHSVELRVPFLDHLLLEWAWTLPADLKLRRGVGKYILRKAMAGKIPDGILGRPKKGFPVPLTDWLRGKLLGACQERLLDSGSASRLWLGARFVENLLSAHRSKSGDFTEQLYALWVYEEWRRAFFAHSDGRFTQPHPDAFDSHAFIRR
jgi:asparagine synthase (glutamine-hydrolysing)